jgi:hypothetical protein
MIRRLSTSKAGFGMAEVIPDFGKGTAVRKSRILHRRKSLSKRRVFERVYRTGKA